MPRWTLFGSLACLVCSFAIPARGDAARTQTLTERSDRLELSDDFIRFQPWEYMLVPPLLAGAVTVRLAIPLDEPNWTSPILADAWARRTLEIDPNTAGSLVTQSIGDMFFYGSLANALLDPVIAAG